MIVMLCRNRVADFEKWKAVFDSNTEAAEVGRASGALDGECHFLSGGEAC
jgi:hypothetical protein